MTILRNSGAKRFRSGTKQESSGAPQTDSEDVDPTEVITLRVSTITADGYSNLFYEVPYNTVTIPFLHTVLPNESMLIEIQVATIKSPYVMRLGAIKNTRFVTMTKSYTRRMTSTEPPSSSLTSSLLVTPSIPSYETELTLQPKAIDERFDGEPSSDLPLAENILATTTPVESILKDSSDTATLPVFIPPLIYQDESLIQYILWVQGNYRGSDRERVAESGDNNRIVQHYWNTTENVHLALSERRRDIVDDTDADILHHSSRCRRQNATTAPSLPVHPKQNSYWY